jgi:tRNA A37 threonylcarbamoyladenosine modification protein TsaB
MIILGIRTDKPEAELYLFDGRKKLAETKWPAHRELAETLNTKIEEILNPGTKISKLRNPITDYSARDLVRGRQVFSYDDLDGVAVFKGPGSFTGLRIGISVANALAYAQSLPIVAKTGGNWLDGAIEGLLNGQNDKVITPEYGSEARTTAPRK